MNNLLLFNFFSLKNQHKFCRFPIWILKILIVLNSRNLCKQMKSYRLNLGEFWSEFSSNWLRFRLKSQFFRFFVKLTSFWLVWNRNFSHFSLDWLHFDEFSCSRLSLTYFRKLLCQKQHSNWKRESAKFVLVFQWNEIEEE